MSSSDLKKLLLNVKRFCVYISNNKKQSIFLAYLKNAAFKLTIFCLLRDNMQYNTIYFEKFKFKEFSCEFKFCT